MPGRAEFSYDLPIIVSAGELVFGGTRYKQGALFPWPELGVSREALWELWVTFKVDCARRPPPSPQQAEQRRRNKRW